MPVSGEQIKYTTKNFGYAFLDAIHPSYTLQTHPNQYLLLHLEIFICRIFISVYLHVVHVALFGSSCLVDFYESLGVGGARGASLYDGDANDDRCHQCHSGERESEINASTAIGAMASIDFTANGISWFAVVKFMGHAMGYANYFFVV